MSLEAILEAIGADGEAQANRIEEQARQEAEEILARAQAQADIEYERIMARCRAQANRERALLVQEARQEARDRVSVVRDRLIDEVLEALSEALKDIRNDSIYLAALPRLVDEALDSLIPSLQPEQWPLIQANPRDRPLLEQILPTARIDWSLDCQGGIIALSPDEDIVVDNTLEARLQQAMPYLRRDLARLFEVDV